MKTIVRLSIATLAASAALGTVPAVAADGPSCLSVTLNQEFIKAYPEAPAACQGVVTQNGVKKLHYKARVTDVGMGSVTLVFLNVRMDPVTGGRPLKFTPPAGVDVIVDGKKVRASDLKKGETLDFWVPEKLQGFHATPESTELIKFALQ